MWRNLVYQQNLSHDCATESLWNKTAFWFAPWGCLMPMAWREANMMTCLLLPTSSLTADLCWEVLPIKGQIILFFFSIFSEVSLGTCSSCVIHHCVFASPLTWPSCTAWQERKVWPWGLLLCRVEQAPPLPCIWWVNVFASALCTWFRINTESSYSISLFLLVFESNLTEVSYFIQINAQVPVVIFLSVYFMAHSLIDISALQTYS